MAELLIGPAILLLIGFGSLITRPRKTMAGDMDAPINVERGRARSEAAMAAPVSDADEEAAAPLVAYVEKIGTGEFPSLAFAADPLGAPIPDGHLVADPAFFHDVTADWLSAFAWPTSPAPVVPFSSVQVVEPDPLELEGPTGVFSKDWIDRIIAEAKAEATR